jgi:hypothetical protein
VPRLRDARFCLAVFAAALLPTAYVEALPAPAGASAPPSVPCPSTAANEAAAVRAAAACKGRVEVMSARDEKLRAFANANGSLTAESAATVQRVRNSAGIGSSRTLSFVATPTDGFAQRPRRWR